MIKWSESQVAYESAVKYAKQLYKKYF